MVACSGVGSPSLVYPVVTPSNAVKFHAGFYVLQFKSTDLSTVVSETNAYPCLRGWQLRFSLTDLMGDVDDSTVYDAGFAAIDAVIGDTGILKPYPTKRIIILFEFKSYDTVQANADHVVPAFMRTGGYDGGEILYQSTLPGDADGGGYITRYWDANVRTRIEAMVVAYGARYNGNDQFEGFGSVEAAWQTPQGTVPPDYVDQLWIGLLKTMVVAKAAFPNCMVIMFLNYQRDKVKKAVNGGTFGTVSAGQYVFPGIKALGIALGGPNTVSNEYGLGGYDSYGPSRTPPTGTQITSGNWGVYEYYNGALGSGLSAEGVIPLCPSGQRPDWNRSNLKGPTDPGGHNTTIPEVLDYARNDLNANYFFIQRVVADVGNTYPTDKWTPILAYFDANPSLKADVTGGCSTTPPSCYTSVVTT